MLQALGQVGQSSNPFEQFDVMQLLVLIALLLLMLAIFIFSVVVICFNGRAIQRSWRVMLNLTAVALGLVWP